MKDYVKIAFVLIWAIVVIVGAIRLYNHTVEPVVKTGTSVNVTLDTNTYMVINSGSVTMAAGSDHFFALTNSRADAFVPNKKDSENRPIGWASDTYFAKAPTQVPGGKWTVATGSPAVTIENAGQPVEVQLWPTDISKNSSATLLSILALCVWALGILIPAMFGFFNW